MIGFTRQRKRVAANRAFAAKRPMLFASAEVTCLARLKIGAHFHSGRLCRISATRAEVQLQAPLESAGEVSLMLPNLPPIAGLVQAIDGRRVTISFGAAVSVCQFLEWLGDRAKILEPEAC